MIRALGLLGVPALLLAGSGLRDAVDVPLGLPEERLTIALDAPAERVALGERLVFDGILSADRTISCSSCHDPDHGFADEKPLSEGVHGRRTLRNAPTLLNRALGEAFMWDGRAATLEEQVLLPIENELEMDLALDDAVLRVASDASYRSEFDQVFGEPPSKTTLAQALADFVRSLLHGGSPVDRFRVGEHGALTPNERAGMWFFESRGGCWRCHVGANFTDDAFRNTGVGANGGKPEDGRFAVTGTADDRGRFKTPTLRGLTLTAPYMHDGSLATLEEVVEFYRGGGTANENLDPRIQPIEMSDREAADLAAFLRALSRDSQAVAAPDSNR